MRLFVVYDGQGEITTVATQPDGAPELTMKLEDGERSGFVDAPEVSFDASGEELVEQLREVQRRNRIADDSGEIRLAVRGEAG
ncbi:hypothetical protein [Streptomyces phaeochromogenes]|uniref:hypothetical protein n=1 Tax=Streptomyces phaeochromogenes TaxID=1923 RepID=UPI0006E45499|nr:hypothetical protein [Streptomyces phaeochromogenes]